MSLDKSRKIDENSVERGERDLSGIEKHNFVSNVQPIGDVDSALLIGC